MTTTLESLPSVLSKFANDYVSWRSGQNKRNNDVSSKRVDDAIVGKLGEYELHQRFPDKVSEPDYARYEKPEFGADLFAGKFKLHVKMCGWQEMKQSAGWLIARKDPIVQMIDEHFDNILVFGYVPDKWVVDWAGWCFVDEMHDNVKGISYYNRPRKERFADRKFGIWPHNTELNGARIPGTWIPQKIKVHGVIENNVLRPIEELGEVL